MPYYNTAIANRTYTEWGDASEAAGVLTCPTILTVFNPTAPVNITDLLSEVGPGLEEVIIRKLGTNDATFVHNTSKLRNISGANIVLGSNQVLHYIKITDTIWQHVGGKQS